MWQKPNQPSVNRRSFGNNTGGIFSGNTSFGGGSHKLNSTDNELVTEEHVMAFEDAIIETGEVTQDFQSVEAQKKKGLTGYERVANYMARNPNSEKEAVNFGKVSPERFAEAQAELGDAVSYDVEKRRMTVNVKQIKENTQQVEALKEAEVPTPRQDNVAAVQEQAAAEGQDVKKPGKLARLAKRFGDVTHVVEEKAQVLHDARVDLQQKAGEKVVSAVKTTAQATGVVADVVTLRHDLKKNISALQTEVDRMKNPHLYGEDGKRIEEPAAEKAPKEQTQSKTGKLFGKIASWFEKKVDAAQALDDKVDQVKDTVVQTAKDAKDATVKLATDAKDYTVEKAVQAKDAYVEFDKKTDKMAHDAGQSFGYKMMAKLDRIKGFITGSDTLKDLKQEVRAVRAENALTETVGVVKGMQEQMAAMQTALEQFTSGKGTAKTDVGGAGNLPAKVVSINRGNGIV